MPIYEFKCSDCCKTFEKILWKEESEPIVCPDCKGERVVRVLSTFSSGSGRSEGAGTSSSCGHSHRGFS